MDMPASHYATCPYDEVLSDGRQVGISHYPVYTSNVRSWISLALLDESVAAPGTEVTLTWGEPDGGTQKPSVERHTQTEIRCVVEECPISVTARTDYRA
jgi:vanillate/3-O-methylgallate O-demethylase